MTQMTPIPLYTIGLTRPYEGWCWLQVNGVYTFPDYLGGRCFADFKW